MKSTGPPRIKCQLTGCDLDASYEVRVSGPTYLSEPSYMCGMCLENARLIAAMRDPSLRIESEPLGKIDA